MPELPEVETTRRGIKPYLIKQKVKNLTVRNGNLRWPVTENLSQMVKGQEITGIERRAKYLIIQLQKGSILVHLGMSGSLRIVDPGAELRKHDHIELVLSSGQCLRYHDPRRFGAWLWAENEPPQLKGLGPEPLSNEFDGSRLYRLSRNRKMAVKPFIMDNRVVVGVGNIYATEALFIAGIRPDRAASRVSLQRYELLAKLIKQVLQAAIDQGGTTLRDFVNGRGEPGYFQQQLLAYGRAGQPCQVCGAPLKEKRLGQRSSVFCANCQR